MLNDTQFSPPFPAAPTGQSLISHAGLNVLTSFLDATGFGALCEEQLADFVPETATHRPGRVLGALAVMLADGGEHVSDLDTLRDSPELFGPVASNATVSRFVERAAEAPEAFTLGFATLTKALRSRIWEAAGKRNPATLATAAGPADHRPRCHPRRRALREGMGHRPLQARFRACPVRRQPRLRQGKRHRRGPGRGAAGGQQGCQLRGRPHPGARQGPGAAARLDARRARETACRQDPHPHRQRRGRPASS